MTPARPPIIGALFLLFLHGPRQVVQVEGCAVAAATAAVLVCLSVMSTEVNGHTESVTRREVGVPSLLKGRARGVDDNRRRDL